jgi:hypothetical protein
MVEIPTTAAELLHSPGPWKLNRHGLIQDCHGRLVALVGPNEADQSLISVALAMLLACKSAIELGATTMRDGPVSENSPLRYRGYWASIMHRTVAIAENRVVDLSHPTTTVMGVQLSSSHEISARENAATQLLEALRNLRQRFHAACIAAGNDPWAANASCAEADIAIKLAEGKA